VNAVLARLDALPADLTPLADAVRGLLEHPVGPSDDDVLRLGHRPWVAPENYAITLYPGLSADALVRYAGRFGFDVPAVYAAFLTAVNGAFVFGMSLAGMPASSPVVNRSHLQCHDLGTAATLWSGEYRKIPVGAFHFGGRQYSSRENVGYFVVGGRILSVRRSGKVMVEWGGLADFLRDEIPISAALDEHFYPPRGQVWLAAFTPRSTDRGGRRGSGGGGGRASPLRPRGRSPRPR
jgi:hypothetical protein